MGVVYKAEDTTLDRTVALKFLAQHLLNDEEAKKRFLREAKAAAALDHANICTVHEIAEVDGKTFLAMAFLKGETLEERIAQGPLSLKDALDIARQVADGLEAAHEAAIVHRDIKPANIMVDAKGRATIMDFGLARLTEASRLTKLDTAMGTVAYMSPEQAQGMTVDSRSDLWSLGCVLYEMVSGQRPFQGVYDQALLYEIVHEEPAALTGLRTGVPIELELLASKCLAKDRDDRYQSAKEIAVDLRTLAEKLKSGRSTILRTTPMSGAVPAAMAAAQTLNPVEALPPDAVVVGKRKLHAVYGLAALVTIALLGVSFVHFTQAPPEKPLRRFSFVPPPGFNASSLRAGLAISPNGRHIAFTTTGANSALWVQDLDQDEPRALAGTEGAILPFWSPNSEFIAYVAGGELRKISVQGGASGLVCPLPAPNFYHGTWSPDGESIVFNANGGTIRSALYEVSSQGGTPEALLTLAEFSDVGISAISVSRPSFLPQEAGRVLVFVVGDARAGVMYARNLDTGQTVELGLGDRPIYSAATGHLIYQSERNVYDLWARPFSPETLEFTSAGFPLRENARQPSLSQDGTLAYLDGSGSSGAQTLVWRDREGELVETIGQQQPTMYMPSLSPDGQRVVVSSSEMGNSDIWVHDLVRSTKTRLTFDAASEWHPTWSPSGDEVAYWLQGVGSSLRKIAADGTGEPVVLVESENNLPSPSWSHDGGYLVYQEPNPDTRMDIRYLKLETDGTPSEPITFLATSASEIHPKLSPNGRFVAYASNESQRYEIYVRPFPEGAGRRQASVNGGTGPRWSSDGNVLYYVSNGALMSVSVPTAQGGTFSQPQQLFESSGLLTGFDDANYDVSADDQRFLTIAPVEGADTAPPMIRIVENWYEEFRDRE